mmetsp:Transcript_16301/g.28508  ORF Transcript_16301/g.28508 Transcript_16301/m.28508 type:complete len:890 (-) Transcript_16301:54-2723(-)|eukprot:CAMPEP_0197656422 /NCGR_PEP_ID=MMETSP1338-20131121/41816_1 /TAXON_ID=43686 ORGANISM="Pelagodinium beii, Strain RCC1491" /NCGR_SAMPLE_ID=MMETSP1338 /ASSEMBLY_ACC=CAM_ASM_000754 /LENGTH=889 /DNA_ID=CAMNT_0043232419 /DNA_START=95 /DNA_END=2764 /DNA_ORIENTATION=+
MQTVMLGASVIFSIAGLVQAATEPDVEPNRVWPADATEAQKNLEKNTKAVCGRTARKPEELLRGAEYPATELNRIPGGEGSLLASIVASRSDAEASFARTQERCGYERSGFTGIDANCEEAWMSYFNGVLFPFAIPLGAALVMVLLHSVCCTVACCRCCRQMICCKEAREPQPLPRPYIMLGIIIWTGASVTQVALCSSLVEVSQSLHSAVDWNLCVAHTFEEEAIYGADWFLGTQPALERLTRVSYSLDADNTTMKTVRSVLSASSDFSQKHDMLRRRIAHFAATLATVGSGKRIFDHRCVFCNVALGQGADGPAAAPPAGFPQNGLLTALEDEVLGSSSEAMDVIRQYAMMRLTGANLTNLARRVKRAQASLLIFDQGLRDALGGLWVRKRPHIDTVESIRHFLYNMVSVFAVIGAVIGWVAFAVTRIRMKRYKESEGSLKYPSGKIHCCSWCCGFFHSIIALLLAGSLLLLSAPAGEACLFVRKDLMTYQGLNDYAHVLGFPVPNISTPAEAVASAGAVKLTQACFAPNRTGDMLEAVDLGGDTLIFQEELSAAFFTMDDRVSEPSVGMATADLLERLRSVAEEFGGRFVLDPVEADNSSGSAGPLLLSSNVQSLLLGSGLEAEDSKAVDGVTSVKGLNTYAELIAGPGQYTFLHGTAGGGFVVRPERPTDGEISSLPPFVGNALVYARNKERLLTSSTALRCDVLPAKGQAAVPKPCSVSEFHDHVISEMRSIRDAAASTLSEAENVKQLFVSDLKADLLSPLSDVKTLRSLLFCQAMWRRLEELDQSFCEEMSPTMARGSIQALAQAVVAFIGLVVQYKSWRRLKDNKVLKDEVARFERRLKMHKRVIAEVVQDDLKPDVRGHLEFGDKEMGEDLELRDTGHMI